MRKETAEKMIFLAIFVLAYSFLCPPVWPADRFTWAVLSYDVNSKYGMIKEEFGTTYNVDSKTIIYIQDAHCNYEAQRNIVNILEELIRDYGIKLVFVEGGVGDSGLSYLRGYGSKEARRSIAEKKLKECKISGEEYLDIVSDLDFEIYGIEQPHLYNEHRDAFLKIDRYKTDLLKFIESVREVVEQLKEKIYNEKLKELENKRKAYENNEIALVSYIEYLNNLCLEYGVNSSIYFEFSRLTEAVSLEKTIYYNSIGKEANAVLNRLTEVLPESERISLLDEAASLEGKGQKQIYDFYIKIRNIAQRKGIYLESYPNFVGFTTFLKVFDSVDMKDIFSDIDGVNRAIITKIVDNMDQWDIVDIDYGLDLFNKIANVKLDKSEFDLYRERKELIKPKSWVESLNRLASKYRVEANLIKDTSQIEEAQSQLERFYQLAFQRDAVFVEKIFSKMDEKGVNKAVLITGGFHSQNIQTLLEEGGARGVVVYPKITTLTDEKIYNSQVRGELSELERWVSGR